MADNVAITAGTGTTVHADEYTHATLGAGKTQLVKLVDGTLDSGTAIAAGGGVEAGALRVTIASDSTGVVSIDDNGGAVTVDGTVTANAGTDLNTSALALEAGGNLAAIKAKTDNIPALGQALAAASLPVILPEATITTLTPPAAITGFATSAKQDTIIGHMDGLEALATTIAGAVSGTEVQVDVLTMPSTAVTNAGLTELAAAINASSQVDVNIAASGATVPVSGTFWQATQPVSGTVTANATLAAETTKVIGTVNIASSQTLATVTAVTAITNALPAGTNAMGKLLPPDIDVTAHTNYVRKYYTNAGAVTDGIIWSPAAGKRWHVVTMYLQTSAAATITLEDDKAGGDDPVWKGELAANSGVVLSFTEKYPMASGEDAADLLVTTTAGNVYVTAVGYEI